MTPMLKVMFIDPVTCEESVYAEVDTDTAADEQSEACAVDHGLDPDDIWIAWPATDPETDDVDADWDGEKERRLRENN
jgi:hypothetical protein